MPKSNESEQRQHISISLYAFNTIKSDSITFTGVENYSGFINKIAFDNDRIDSFIQKIQDNPIELKHKIKSLDKGKTLKIRLGNDLYGRLYDEFWPSSDPYITQGMYIKQRVEEYASKSFYEREREFFSDTIDLINSAISSKQLLKIKAINHNGDNKTLYEDFKPYRLSEEHEGNYIYLIGYSRRGDNASYKIVSRRLSRIKVEPRKANYSLSNTEQTEIEKKILKVGVPYLYGEPMSFTIRLTPEGVDLYNSLYHQRPMYKEFDKEKLIMKFENITERQFTNYFFNFGKDLEVISPLDTKIKLLQRYKDAYNSYNSNG